MTKPYIRLSPQIYLLVAVLLLSAGCNAGNTSITGTGAAAPSNIATSSNQTVVDPTLAGRGTTTGPTGTVTGTAAIVAHGGTGAATTTSDTVAGRNTGTNAGSTTATGANTSAGSTTDTGANTSAGSGSGSTIDTGASTGAGSTAATGASTSAGSTTATGASTSAGSTTATGASTSAGSTTATGASTSGESTTTGSTTAPVTPVLWASLDFINNPGGNDPNAFALTFDDGPDGSSGFGGTNNTAYVLDQLKALNLKATFFVCDKVWTDVQTDSLAQADIKRMINEGHHIGNHTVDHFNLSTLTAAQVDAEFGDNANDMVSAGVLPSNTSMTMYRAPFGYPFQANTSAVSYVSAATAKYGVHIGWGLDANDWACANAGQNANCVINNVKAQLDKGQSGIILMHAAYRTSGDAIPAVVQAVYNHGGHFVMVQDMIQAKYGATSDQIFSANATANFSASDISAAANHACSKNSQSIAPPYP